MTEKDLSENIILIGFMGCGKSAVGAYIAAELGYKFVDTDQLIIQQHQMPISDIFSMKGENYFRNCETETLTQLLPNQKLVIATGGGLPMFNDNFERLQHLGSIFYIKVGVKLLTKRLFGNTNRPLIAKFEKTSDLQKWISETLAKRQLIYHNAHKIISGANSIEEVGNAIIRKM